MTASKNSRNRVGTPSLFVRTTTNNSKANKPHLESIRSNSVPVMENVLVQNKIKERSTDLDLSIDPLTGECLASRTETTKLANINEDSDVLEENTITKTDDEGGIGSYTENFLSPSNCRSSTGNIHIRKLSSEEELSSSSSRRSSRSSRRKSSHLADIQEQYIPDEKILEVRIDPFTGHVETSEVCRSKSSPTPNSPNLTNFQELSSPFLLTKTKEPENKSESQEYDIEKRRKLSVEVTKVSTKTTGDQQDDGIGSLPITPIDKFVERPPRLSVPPAIDDRMEFPALDDTFDKFGAYQRDQRETSAGNSSGSVGGINQYQTVSLDGGYGADSICSWDEASSVAPDDDDDSRPVSAQPSNTSNSSQTIVPATSNGNLSSISTSSSTSALNNNSNNITNQVNRTCSGAISRAMERLNANQPSSNAINTAQSPSSSDNNVNDSMEDKESDDDSEKSGSSDTCNNSVMRRQSSPMVHPSSS